MRKKKINKNKNISVSLPIDQIIFIEQNPRFNISKFFQLKLKEYMELVFDVQRMEKEYNINKKEVIC